MKFHSESVSKEKNNEFDVINQCAQKQWHIKESLKECSKESVLQITISKHKVGKNVDRSVAGSRTYN